MSTSDPTFLIVDQTPSSRRLVKVFLKKLGFQDVVEADSAADALEKLRSKAVHFIISDVDMVDLSSQELCRQVRAEAGYEQVPFVVLTSDRHAVDRAEAQHAGISDYLSKPVELSSLEEKVQEVLERVSTGTREQTPAL